MLSVDGAVLLLWPKDLPAHGALFWLLIAGLPNAVFVALVALNRADYESRHLRVLYYNDHRERRRMELVEEGQQSLKVFGYAYRLPLECGTFAQTVAKGMSLLKAQPLRDGTTIVRHLLLPEDDESDVVDPRLRQVLAQSSLTREGKLYAQLLAPLLDIIDGLAVSGVLPAVRLMVDDDVPPGQALQQIRVVLGAFHLPALECRVIPGCDGLMPVDAWLDAKETRPLLLMAAALHDVPPAESTEGGVAILLAPETLRLPSELVSCATIHRPVSRPADEFGEGVALSLLWGKAAPSSVERAWVTGFAEDQHALIGVACRRTGLERLTTHESRFNQDRVVGHAGNAAGWLAVTAAAEYGGERPQLILNRARTMQAAIVRAHPPRKS
ncbi:hypothetical protein WKR88_19015 [Trinickia caryophylli]|uniref:hypothetical protein n=1 Tax=Trinickia caryophylli TaxID=28094 RepID=UPI00111BE315|nr:hypothetical protein [Trinickia caryophylli]TRX16942.1 hypothetical protein FNF07_00970 [Trinickia caryophylli]WQE12325.1 hypothetical protein U0034_02575 [Trinickia caryophylli]